MQKSITAPCKRDKDGKLYIRYNDMMRFALGFFNVFGALVLGLSLFFFIAGIQVEGLIALAYGGISFLALGILLGGKQFKLDNNCLYWGRRANKSIEFSKLRYLCREVPRCYIIKTYLFCRLKKMRLLLGLYGLPYFILLRI